MVQAQQDLSAPTGKQLIRHEVKDGVALLTLNDPPANTYSYEMMQQLDACILKARMDEPIQVIVITGAGEKFFCAGANIAMLSEVVTEAALHACGADIRRVFLDPRTSDVDDAIVFDFEIDRLGRGGSGRGR